MPKQDCMCGMLQHLPPTLLEPLLSVPGCMWCHTVMKYNHTTLHLSSLLLTHSFLQSIHYISVLSCTECLKRENVHQEDTLCLPRLLHYVSFTDRNVRINTFVISYWWVCVGVLQVHAENKAHLSPLYLSNSPVSPSFLFKCHVCMHRPRTLFFLHKQVHIPPQQLPVKYFHI